MILKPSAKCFIHILSVIKPKVANCSNILCLLSLTSGGRWECCIADFEVESVLIGKEYHSCSTLSMKNIQWVMAVCLQSLHFYMAFLLRKDWRLDNKYILWIFELVDLKTFCSSSPNRIVRLPRIYGTSSWQRKINKKHHFPYWFFPLPPFSSPPLSSFIYPLTFYGLWCNFNSLEDRQRVLSVIIFSIVPCI